MIKTVYLQFSRCAILLACLFLYNYVGAQVGNPSHTIHLKNGNITAEANANQWLTKTAQAMPPKEAVQVLVHFNSLPTEGQRATLQQNGITLLDYIPDNTYTALLQYPLNTDAILSTPVYSIINVQPEWKADGYLWNTVSTQHTMVKVLVSFYASIETTTIKQYIASVGGQVEAGPMEKYGSYKVSIDANRIRTIAQWYGVRYISQVSDIVPFDLQSRPSVKGNIAVAAPAFGGYGLTGDSVTVGVGDNASGIYHADLKDRITNFNPVPMAHHGEHVNGIVGGAAIIDPLAASMAPRVSLVDYVYDQVLSATGAMYKDFNMTITNNSYGTLLGDCSYSGTYDIYGNFLDSLSLQYPEVLHVFASGNDGGMHCTPYLKGFATVGGGYQPAKNNVVVGSMTDLLYDAHDESRGPVKDGRLKPEIVAVGLGAYSTVDLDQYAWAAGTSMASPQVAGGLAILTQHYKRLNGGKQPRADELKTILLNGAMDLGNPGPDFTFGFGSMDVYRSLQIIDKKNYTSSTIANGDDQSFTITVPANTARVKVMLSWQDVPASPTSSKQLVNDLDLSVVTPLMATHLPLVLDPAPDKVNNVATEQADHLNNTEQVTINDPVPGTYIVNVKGYSLPAHTQRYVLAYDMIPKGIQLTYPIGGEQLSDVDTIRFFWNAVSNGNPFTLQLSTDNGGLWITIANNIPADTRFFSFLPTGINSGNCLVRLTRNNSGEVMTSGRFAINTQPMARLDTSQCPGYVNIHWSKVPGATSYELFAKKGPQMQLAGTATDTLFSFRGMSLTEKSYVAVQPIINGIPGYRSIAVITIADNGNCTKAISAGDIMIEKVIGPMSGRMFTSTQLGASESMKLQLRNLYTADCNNYTVSWQVNGGAWQTATSPTKIPAHDATVVSIPGLDLSTLGSYTIRVAVTNQDLTDPQTANDTTTFTIRNLPNAPVDLTGQFADDFESMGKFAVEHDSIGVSPNAHWDFFNTTDTGRMRSFVNDDITIGGSRSISLDDNQNVHTGSKNTFVGTFNLAAYDTANAEVRLDFDYLLHSTPKSQDGNIVTARGNDNAPWNKLHAYDLSAYAGYVRHVRSVSLTDAVKAGKRNFSTSTQVSFGQNDTSLIAATHYGNGLTLDNVKIYTVTNDAVLAGIVAPLPDNCGLPGTVPLIVQVRNGVTNTIYNIKLFYSFDGGTVYTGSIDSIKGKGSINYTFSKQLDIAPGSTHSLNVWINAAGDSYLHNDTLLDYHIRNSQIITSYPYLENFESGDGGYYSDGINNSWAYGTPSSLRINKAASGTKAWKTSLNGNYNNLEKSYLYSPCFDLSRLSNPVLSFSAALNIENCGGSLCDAAYVEYSFDGGTWNKLGTRGLGTNWYDSTFDVWNAQNSARWRVASIPVPMLGSGQTTHFRFVLTSDPGVGLDGFAVDDIHIYDLANPIAPAIRDTSLSLQLNTNEWTDYILDNKLLAAVQPLHADIKTAEVYLYAHDTVGNLTATQYTMPRSYALQVQPRVGGTAIVTSPGEANLRLYLTDSEVIQIMKDTTCPSCTRLTDAYSLGITQYDNDHKAVENGTMLDNTTDGYYTWHPQQTIKWVPYDKGYYAEFTSRPFSEFWFNNGGPTGNFPANKDYLNFIAYRSGANVSTYWYALIDTATNLYTLESSNDGIHFATVTDTLSRHLNPGQYSYTDPGHFTADTVIYYRLRWTMTGKNGFHYSPIRKIDMDDSGATLINMNVRMTGHNNVLVNWTSFIDPVVHYYKLERAIGNRGYTNISNTNALHLYGETYEITDDPGTGIRGGTLIHYRLTAILNDGNQVVLPIRTVEWRENNTVVNVYPNPNFDGNFTIDWNADAGTTMHVSIMDAVGRSLYETTATAAQWDNTTTVQTSRGPKGVYFARIIIGGKRYTAKLVYE